MVHSGDNGFHITGDTDPEHVAVRRDMPASAHISYNSKEV